MTLVRFLLYVLLLALTIMKVLLAQHFWHGIGMGWEAGAALEAALERCPPAVGEYVVRHW